MALALQLQRIVSSPLTQELRLSPSATAGASLDSILPGANAWLLGSSSSSSSTNTHNDSLSDVIAPVQCHYQPILLQHTNPFYALSLQPFPFADLDFASNNTSTGSFYSANSSQSYPFLSSSSISASSSSAASSSGMQDMELYYRHSTTMNIVYCVAYCIVFIVGLIGNSFVIAVVLRAPRMRTVTNYFIVNLAIADILVIVFCLPATLMSNIFVRK